MIPADSRKRIADPGAAGWRTFVPPLAAENPDGRRRAPGGLGESMAVHPYLPAPVDYLFGPTGTGDITNPKSRRVEVAAGPVD